MERYRQQVETAVRAAVLHSPTSYSWFGRRNQSLSRSVKRALTARTARNYLLFHLQMQLYADFYRQGFAAPASGDAMGPPALGRTPFVELLSHANCGQGSWESGWDVVEIHEGRLAVRRDGLTLWARREDCLPEANGELEVGERCAVRFPKESLNISPGFYMVHSDCPLAYERGQTLVRFYWNLTSEGAAPFVEAATRLLNEGRLPYRLKVLKEPSHYTRCDAGVLYIRKHDYRAVAGAVRQIYPLIARHMRQGTPVFTRTLAPGLGLAEDPGQGDSFGQHRCRLLADGIILAHEQGRKGRDEQMRTVADRFAAEGISLDAPYLNAGANDDYEWESNA